MCSIRIFNISEVILNLLNRDNRHPAGLLHLIERFAYGPTKVTFNSRDQLQEFLDINGGHCDALSDRKRVASVISNYYRFSRYFMF